jgi:hypothetical protein
MDYKFQRTKAPTEMLCDIYSRTNSVEPFYGTAIWDGQNSMGNGTDNGLGDYLINGDWSNLGDGLYHGNIYNDNDAAGFDDTMYDDFFDHNWVITW